MTNAQSKNENINNINLDTGICGHCDGVFPIKELFDPEDECLYCWDCIEEQMEPELCEECEKSAPLRELWSGGDPHICADCRKNKEIIKYLDNEGDCERCGCNMCEEDWEHETRELFVSNVDGKNICRRCVREEDEAEDEGYCWKHEEKVMPCADCLNGVKRDD
jgi:hypothetical protein